MAPFLIRLTIMVVVQARLLHAKRIYVPSTVEMKGKPDATSTELSTAIDPHSGFPVPKRKRRGGHKDPKDGAGGAQGFPVLGTSVAAEVRSSER